MVSLKRSPLTYMGSKYYLSKTIIKLLDYSVEYYVEPFFGSGQVFFTKPPHKTEIINDINNDLVNFYLVWYEHKNKLIESLESLPYSSYVRNQWVSEWTQGFKGSDDFERAVRYFYINRTSFLGMMKRRFFDPIARKGSRTYYNAIKILEVMHSRIRNAMILNYDFRKVLSKAAEHRCAIYVDPPYYGFEKHYGVDFSKKDHEDLASILNDMPQSKIIVSYYPFDGIEQLYPKDRWIYITKTVTKHSGIFTLKDEKKKKANELLILNYEPEKNLS
jgi:DNA adenine methylase